MTKIAYLVVNHTEPDHAGSVERLLELNSGVEDYCDWLCGWVLKGNRERRVYSDTCKRWTKNADRG